MLQAGFSRETDTLSETIGDFEFSDARDVLASVLDALQIKV